MTQGVFVGFNFFAPKTWPAFTYSLCRYNRFKIWAQHSAVPSDVRVLESYLMNILSLSWCKVK